MLKEYAAGTQVYLVTGYTDLRSGIDGLAAIVQGKLSLDPYSQSLFLFCGRRRDRLKASGQRLRSKLLEDGSAVLRGKATDFFCCTSGWTTDVSDGRGMKPKQDC